MGGGEVLSNKSEVYLIYFEKLCTTLIKILNKYMPVIKSINAWLFSVSGHNYWEGWNSCHQTILSTKIRQRIMIHKYKRHTPFASYTPTVWHGINVNSQHNFNTNVHESKMNTNFSYRFCTCSDKMLALK